MAELLCQFGKFNRMLCEHCHGISERAVSPDRLRKFVGVERLWLPDIHHRRECEGMVEHLHQKLWNNWNCACGHVKTRPAYRPLGRKAEV
ncbi:MAG: hypothetical protein ACR5K7_04050 [Symbiopectobacterium sp.]